MTPGERIAKAFSDSFDEFHGIYRLNLIEEIDTAIIAAVAEEREACCRDICNRCADPKWFESYFDEEGRRWMHRNKPGVDCIRCDAATIRVRGQT